MASRALAEEIGAEDFIRGVDEPAHDDDVRSGVCTSAGGVITAHVRLEGASLDRFREVLITGDFFVTPPRVILDLEASLRGAPIAEARGHIRDFLAKANVGLLTVSADDFANAVEAALAQGSRAPAESK